MANHLFRNPDVVFIHIPKNSGSSMRAVLGQRRKEQIFGTIPTDWPTAPRLAVIRAPKARFLSAVRMFKYGIAEPDNYYHKPRMPELTVTQALDILEDPEIPFDRTIREMHANLKHHLLQQTHPFQCLAHATEVLRFETLADDYARFARTHGLPTDLPHVRRANTGSDAITMTAEEHERFARLFADDLTLLGYDMDDRPTGKMSDLSKSQPQIYDLWPRLFSSRYILAADGQLALPDPDVDLAPFAATRLPGQPARTWPGRRRSLVAHFKSLRPEFGGASYRSFLVACAIVTLRRSDPGPLRDHAATLFFRAIEHDPETLWKELNLRWLTSVADTLADHGRDGEERAYGMAGAILANTVKLAETERRTYMPRRHAPPRVQLSRGGPLFDGVIAFGSQRGDMIRNLVARVDALSETSGIGGGLLREIVARVEREDTVIARMNALAGQPKPPLAGRFKRRILEWVLNCFG